MAGLREADEKALVRRCWEEGDITYLLHAGQMELTDCFLASPSRRYVVCCSRRYGKSFWLLVLGVQACLQKPGAQVRYAAPTHRMCRAIVEPHMRQILADCPPNLAPAYKRQQGKWSFPNGSEFVMAGCDLGGAERLRGTSTDLGLIDEAGFFSEDLDYVYGDVLLPQLITTNGRILMVSTPARSPAHPFTKYCLTAELEGAYQHRTIFDAPHIKREVAIEFIDEVGGIDTTTARREYLAEVVVDEDLAVVPEFFKNELSIVKEAPLPSHFDAYTFADFGYNDLTAVVFVYYDFQRSKIVIYDELEKARSNTGDIAPAILKKEEECFGQPVLMRVADAPLQVLADLADMHDCPFGMARKDDKDAALNALRLACTNGLLEIHPRCVRTIAHLRHGIWKKLGKDYERSGDFGHFDFIDAAVYAVRHVDRTRNPYPVFGDDIQGSSHWIRGLPGFHPGATSDGLRQIWGRPRGVRGL